MNTRTVDRILLNLTSTVITSIQQIENVNNENKILKSKLVDKLEDMLDFISEYRIERKNANKENKSDTTDSCENIKVNSATSANDHLGTSNMAIADSCQRINKEKPNGFLDYERDWSHVPISESDINLISKELNSLQEDCLDEDCCLTLHLRNLETNYLYQEIISITADQLEEFDYNASQTLRFESQIDLSKVSRNDIGKIIVLRFKSAAICKQMKQSMDGHVRQMYNNYLQANQLYSKSYKGIPTPEKYLYKLVQAFIIGCPEPLRKLKRHLRQLAIDNNLKLSNYIGTPIVNNCNKRFSPFSDQIKQALRERAVMEKFDKKSIIGKDVIMCCNIKGVVWLSVEDAIKQSKES